MYIHNLNPTLISLGPIEIRWYGLVYLLGFLFAYYLLTKYKEKLDLDNKQIENILLALLIGMLIGARIFHYLFADPSVFIKNPLQLFKIWEGGMSFFGALLGMTTGLVWYLKKIGKDWKPTADIITLAATTTLIFGRIANFINAELVGRVADVPWCVIFPNVDNLCRHPYQIYAAISHIILLGVLILIYKKQKNPGTTFFSFIIGYSALRFITDFFRVDAIWMLGLTSWQWVSVVGVIIGIFLIRKGLFVTTSK